MASAQKYRLMTRSDFDGLVCAVLFKELDMIDEIVFVHPKDMQDEKIPVTARDITTNLPYVPGIHLAFDHHASETTRVVRGQKNHVIDPRAASTARVVYNHFGGKSKFPNISDDLLAAVDKSDAAQFSREEVLNPTGWALLDFIMDPRTGLGRFKTFRISNYDLMTTLIDACRQHPVDEILRLPDVKERADLYFSHKDKFAEQLKRCGTEHKNLVVLDLRKEDMIYVGNRFGIYAAYPQCNISIHVIWGVKKQNTVFAVGKSILNRTSKTHIGDLMLEYSGGGHEAAGTCQIDNDRAEQGLQELIRRITADG